MCTGLSNPVTLTLESPSEGISATIVALETAAPPVQPNPACTPETVYRFTEQDGVNTWIDALVRENGCTAPTDAMNAWGWHQASPNVWYFLYFTDP